MQTLRPNESRGAGFPAPPVDAEKLEFALDGLRDVRSMVATSGAAAGLSQRRAGDLVVAASELAANSVLHGGGTGVARAWSEDDAILVEVHDAGEIAHPERLGRHATDPTEAGGGRGLWIANQLCDEVAIRSGAEGTRVRLRMALAETPI